MMFSWCFSDLLTSFGDFLADDSGYVQPREGLGLGWVAGALAALAVLFHAPAAQANPNCYGLHPGECGWKYFFAERCYPEHSNCMVEQWCLSETGQNCYKAQDKHCSLCP